MMDGFLKSIDLGQIHIVLSGVSPSTCMVTLCGEMDHSMHDKVSQFISENTPSQATAMIVGMTELIFMDSSGVKLLHELCEKFGQNRLAIYQANENIHRILEVSDLSSNVTFIQGAADVEDWRWIDREAA